MWTDAYGLVESTPENAAIKALLIYNLAQAHTNAYEIDGDPIHLKHAQQLLRSDQANLELLYDEPAQLQDERARSSRCSPRSTASSPRSSGLSLSPSLSPSQFRRRRSISRQGRRSPGRR